MSLGLKLNTYTTHLILLKRKQKIKTYQDYVEPHNNLTYLRHIFITCNQETPETIDNYVTDLKNKATLYEFGDLRESLIRDNIVCGI